MIGAFVKIHVDVLEKYKVKGLTLLLFLFQMNLSQMTHTPPALATVYVGVNQGKKSTYYTYIF